MFPKFFGTHVAIFYVYSKKQPSFSNGLMGKR